jgi:hypothetical protein
VTLAIYAELDDGISTDMDALGRGRYCESVRL